MGGLGELLGQRVYFDTNVIIYTVENYPLFTEKLKILLSAMNDGQFIAVTSELSLAETLVKPFRDRNDQLQSAYRKFLTPSLDFEIIPVSREILESSAQIRATTSLKLPDSIHWATANLHNCNSFLTNDSRFKNVHPDIVKLNRDSVIPLQIPSSLSNT